MSLRRRAQIAVGALILAVPLAGAASPAYADTTTGSISGTLTTTDGQNRTYYDVTVTNDSGYYQDVFVQDSGTYQFTNVPPGQYTVEYEFDGVQQWYHGKASRLQADPVTVVAGQDTAITDTALPTGTLVGTLTDHAGNPVPDATVWANDPGRALNATGFTDPDGHFSMNAMPGDYEIEFRPSQYPTLDLYDSGTQIPTKFTVTAGDTTTVDEQLPATGSISGHFSDEHGQPAANVTVNAYRNDGSGGFTTTDENGDYTFPYLYVGSGYLVSFQPQAGWEQYAYGATEQADATRFEVTEGGNTVVNDQALGTGSIAVSVKDSVTGQPIADFCASVGSSSACSDGSGQATLTEVRGGTQSLFVYDTANKYLPVYNQPVTVVAGQTTAVTVALAPGAFIDTVVEDASTGAPVSGVCVAQYGGTSFVAVDGFGYCSDSQGKVRIGPIAAGSYRLYADTHAFQVSGDYGDQWVGANGGTGVMAQAAVTNVKAGKEVNGPVIRLDPPGTVTGVVTDGGTGQPVAGATVTNSAIGSGSGSTYRSTETNATGHYTLTGLGPYAWPLLVTPESLPYQWTGGVANRTRAATVTVPAGATVTYNDTLSDGVTVSGTVRHADGTPYSSGRITAYNVGTGDPIGVAQLGSDGTYHLPLIGSQNVKLYIESYTSTRDRGWYGGTDFASATPVDVPVHKDLSLNITMG
ncbi:MSCRAMM family protein [Rugosimonospora africana]|uniref:alpha-amylase n=1 Tax=Rugosimonospora africana TaxID=556532 RepID=A0A8J3QK51_9ACTN|nr:carboxypeptidase-like regulatory domain-containing protein [Rugosimonospora africana]GIH12076.1 hypothetical protein Raf01_02480 [Rugosimonospora africana]